MRSATAISPILVAYARHACVMSRYCTFVIDEFSDVFRFHFLNPYGFMMDLSTFYEQKSLSLSIDKRVRSRPQSQGVTVNLCVLPP
jgi:hypothetical protein